jgi:hypothetical protein
MVYYIRFLKPPRLHANSVNAVITITNDLGDEHLSQEVDLSVDVDCLGGKAKARWRKGSMALGISCSVSHGPTSLPSQAKLTVSCIPREKEQSASSARGVIVLRRSGNIEQHFTLSLPPILPARCDVQLYESQAASLYATRHFQFCNGGRLELCERLGECIEGHAW